MKILLGIIKRLNALDRCNRWFASAALAAYLLLLIAVLSLKWTRASFSDQVVSKDVFFKASTWVCTHSQGYWKTHPEAWPLDEIMLGGQTYSKETALEILNNPPKGDAAYVLAVQLIAAKLNIAGGADDSLIADSILAADAWLSEHPIGTDPKGEAREQGIALAEKLEAYNNGEIGPGKCDDKEPPTSTPTSSPSDTTLEAEKSAEASWKKKEGHSVSGEICVVNLGVADTQDLSILDQVQYRLEGADDFQDLNGAELVIESEDPIPACKDRSHPETCKKKCYDYTIAFEPPQGAVAFRNIASITITNHSGWMPGDENCPGPDLCPFGPLVIADFELSEKAQSQEKTDRASEPIENLTPEIIGSPVAEYTATPTPSPSETSAPTSTATATSTPTETPTPE